MSRREQLGTCKRAVFPAAIAIPRLGGAQDGRGCETDQQRGHSMQKLRRLFICLSVLAAVTATITPRAHAAEPAAPHPDVVAAFDELERYVASVAGLNGNQRKSLRTKLDAAEASYRRGDVCNATINQLKSFMGESKAIGNKNPSLGNELYRRGWLLQYLVIVHLPSGIACEIGIQWIVDPSLRPLNTSLPGVDGGPARPIAALEGSSGGAKADFISNEIVVVSDDPSIPLQIAGRWRGVIASSHDPSGSGPAADRIYLLRLDPSGADTSKLSSDLAASSPGVQEALRFSSAAGAQLFAVAAAERTRGFDIGVNFVHPGQTLLDEHTHEADIGPGGFNVPSSSFVGDAFDWNYLATNTAQDIGVTDAWMLLERGGRFDNKTKIGIHDQGFKSDADFPTGGTISSDGRPGTSNCSGGSPCPWHGTSVVHAAMAVLDNDYGVAGPAGPVGIPIASYRAGDSYYGSVELAHLATLGAKIINMSYAGEVPAAGVPFTRFSELATATLAGFGVLLIAAAGNEDKDVDATDCLVVCWEEEAVGPCENVGVVCVGALAMNSRLRAGYSNWGQEDVDIFAPGTILAGPDPAATAQRTDGATDYAQPVSGTSVAAPFLAGVAALVRAANPALSGSEIWSIIRRTAHEGASLVVERYVDASAAVRAALPAMIRIESPRYGQHFARGVSVPFSAFVWEGSKGSPTVQWTSHVDGVIGSGSSFGTPSLSFGRHEITARATFPDGTVKDDWIAIFIDNTAPTVEILQPADGATVFRSQIIRFEGKSTDINNLETGSRLADHQVEWQVLGSPTPFAEGHSVRARLNLLVGVHTIIFRGTDGEFTAEDTIQIHVIDDPDNMPPEAEIIDPDEGAVFLADRYDEERSQYYALVSVQGRATDREDDQLSATGFVWWIQADGSSAYTSYQDLAAFEARLYLPPGRQELGYTITLSVRDSAGNAGYDQVHVTVETLI